MESVPGHPRLHRRVATYYHRAAIPKDIKATYPKTEEKSSLRTTDFEEAKRRVRIEAARVDRLFDDHRKMLQQAKAQALQELTDNQIADIREVYYRHLLEEDEETRLEGFYDDDEPLPDAPALSFEEYAELDATVDDANRQRRACCRDDISSSPLTRPTIGFLLVGQNPDQLFLEIINRRVAYGDLGPIPRMFEEGGLHRLPSLSFTPF